MNRDEFIQSTQEADSPPEEVSPLLRSLWLDRKGDWKRAHEIAQEIPGPAASRVHAYLHRVEGDLGNAGYWYRRAGVPPFQGSLEEEWNQLLNDLWEPS